MAGAFKKSGSKGSLSGEVVLIFVTVGTADKGIEFTRLIVAMDEIARKIDEEVVMQIGSIEYQPRYARYFRYVSFSEALVYFQKASLVVGHGGTGTILNSLRFRVPLIVVPRRIQYGELDRDDHQLEIAKRLEEEGSVEVVYEMEELELKVRQRLREKKSLVEKASPERERLIQFLRKFIERERGKRGDINPRP
jgi:beta-1,4-N-acetylglucosaminyltransferase